MIVYADYDFDDYCYDIVDVYYVFILDLLVLVLCYQAYVVVSRGDHVMILQFLRKLLNHLNLYPLLQL
jgi:hypothetical protein